MTDMRLLLVASRLLTSIALAGGHLYSSRFAAFSPHYC
jgi:hypothetical protein